MESRSKRNITIYLKDNFIVLYFYNDIHDLILDQTISDYFCNISDLITKERIQELKDKYIKIWKGSDSVIPGVVFNYNLIIDNFDNLIFEKVTRIKKHYKFCRIEVSSKKLKNYYTNSLPSRLNQH